MQIFTLLAAVAALSPIALLVVIIIWHRCKPDNVWTVVLNEWQTLAAALIGFSALAMVLLLQSLIDRSDANHKQIKLDWAVISGIRADLKNLYEESDFILSEITPTDDEMTKMDVTQCESLTARIRNFEHSPPAMTNVLAASGAGLTPAVVPLVTDAIRIQSYPKNFGTVDFLSNCSSAPAETVVRHLVHLLAIQEKAAYMVEFIDTLEEQSLGSRSYSPLETADPEVSELR